MVAVVASEDSRKGPELDATVEQFNVSEPTRVDLVKARLQMSSEPGETSGQSPKRNANQLHLSSSANGSVSVSIGSQFRNSESLNCHAVP